MEKRKVFMVLRGSCRSIVSRPTTNKELAEKYCEKLRKKAKNPNSYYVATLTLIEA